MKRTAWRAAMFLVSVSVGTLTTAARIAPAWADDDRVLHTRYDGVTNDFPSRMRRPRVA
jgi:hypothetical protein